MKKSELLSNLSASQYKAASHIGGPALVVAGPGTGKTTVITRRIAWLIESGRAKPEEILALTFTDKAAREMESRVDQLLPYGYVDTNIMTFHALGNQIIQDYGLQVGVKPNAQLATEFQQHLLLHEALESLKGLKILRPAANPGQYIQSLLSYFSRLQDNGLDSKDFLQQIKVLEKKSGDRVIDWGLYKEVSKVFAAYEQTKQAKGYVDFGDQLLLPYRLLKQNPAIAHHYQTIYKYILVDEFQDTNHIQADMLYLLSQKHRNLMVVGDDDQSIYQFRGAALENILKFRTHYRKSDVYVLTDNYRSTQELVDAAYELINHNNPERLEPKLGISKHLKAHSKGAPPLLLTSPNQAAELGQVVDLVRTQLETTPLDQLAVLCRNNGQAADLIGALQHAGIPVATQPNRSLLLQPVVRQCIDFVRVLHDPDDTAALYRYLISPKLRLPVEDVMQLTAQARQANQSLAEYVTALAQGTAVHTAVLALSAYRRLTLDHSPGELLYQFITDDGYLDGLVNQAEKDPVMARDVVALASFFTLVNQMAAVEDIRDSHSLWRHIQTMFELQIFTDPDEAEAQDGISVLTIHRSKGLEFETVILYDLSEGSFPGSRHGELLKLPQNLLEEPSQLTQNHIAEERRLFYVALTRAKRQLYLTYSPDHGGKRQRKPSRFLYELFGPNLEAAQTESTAAMPASIQQFARLSKVDKAGPLPLAFPETNGWLELTPNQLADYASDPAMFYLRHVLRFPSQPNHRAIYGTAIHASLEVYWKARAKQEPLKLSQILQVFKEAWRHQGFASPRHESERFKAGQSLLRKLYKTWNEQEYEVKAVERSFTFEVEALKLRIRGRYDLVISVEEGVEIRDFKTSNIQSHASAQTRLRESLQLQIYALAWQHIEAEPVGAISLDFVETGLLVRRTKIDLNKTIERLGEIVAGIRAGQYPNKGRYPNYEAPQELL